MKENINALIDKNLSLICESNENQFTITHFVDIENRKLGNINVSRRFAEKMEEKDLININGEFAYVSEFGDQVYNFGGWLKHLREQDIIANKLASDLKYKDDLELEKIETDLALAKKMLEEYPKTKWIARIGLGIAICLALLELVKFLM
jgi:hypothetical protein